MGFTENIPMGAIVRPRLKIGRNTLPVGYRRGGLRRLPSITVDAEHRPLIQILDAFDHCWTGVAVSGSSKRR